MADNFDIVEEALRLLSPQRYRGGGEVKRFDGQGDSQVTVDTPGSGSGLPSYTVAGVNQSNVFTTDPATGEYVGINPLHYGNVAIGALDSRLWSMFAPESRSMDSEFSAFIMGEIINRAVASMSSNKPWDDATINAFQQRIAAEVTQYIHDGNIYDLLAEDPSNPEFVE